MFVAHDVTPASWRAVLDGQAIAVGRWGGFPAVPPAPVPPAWPPAPAAPTVPIAPAFPVEPALPVAPAVSAAPALPVEPAFPEAPAPAFPVEPALPVAPALPSVPRDFPPHPRTKVAINTKVFIRMSTCPIGGPQSARTMPRIERAAALAVRISKGNRASLRDIGVANASVANRSRGSQPAQTVMDVDGERTNMDRRSRGPIRAAEGQVPGPMGKVDERGYVVLTS